jgi:type IV secretory pathway protease TraF
MGVCHMVPKVPQIGDLVTFLPPALPMFDLARSRGYLAPGEYVLKRIAASAGDVVTIDAPASP